LATRDPLDGLPAGATKRATFVLHSHDGYTTNLALEDFAAEDALLAHSWSGAPLEQEPRRPGCGWWCHIFISGRAPKWLQSIEFLEQDAPGYWEVPRLSQTAAIPGPSSAYSGD